MSTATHGYTNTLAQGRPNHNTVHKLGSGKTGDNTVVKAVSERTLAAQAVVSVTPRDKDKEFVIEITGHNAKVGDICRFYSGPAQYFEYDIIEILSVDTFVIQNVAGVTPVAADTAKIMFFVSLKSDSEGNMSVTPGPAQFVQDGLDVEVNEDSAVAANNKPMPSGLFIKKDGEYVPVTKDTAVPANTVGIPVEVVAASGTPINITAGDLNVQLTHVGVNADSTRIGDGTTELAITVAGEALVKDQDVLTELQGMAAQLPATLGQKASAASLSTVLSTEQEGLIGALTEAAPASDTASSGLNGRLQRIAQRITSLISLIPASLGQKASADSFAVVLSTEQEGLIGALTEAAPASDTASSGLNGRLQRIAQRVTSLIALVPASLGQKTMANSFAVTLASDQSALSTTQTALTGTYQEDLTVTDGAVETLIAPAGAKWVILQADDTNTGNMRVKIGAAATTTSGMQLQPGRDMKLDCGGDVSYTMEVGFTGKLYAQFGA